MSINKTKGRKATLKNSTVLSAARRTALAGVRKAAFGSGQARNVVVAACRAACGPRPVLALYTAAKLELQIGFMAAALARKGDNREPETLMDHCRVRLTKYAGFGGKQKLAKGQLGRRSKDEELAYGSARVQASAIFKEASVTVADKRGGNTAQTRKPRPAAKATAKQAANDAKPVVRKYKGKDELVRYAGIQAAALLATVNRNAGIAPVELKSAVQDFHAAIKKLGA
jgi:hypothetical protein